MKRPGILLDADALAGLDAMLTEAYDTEAEALLEARDVDTMDEWEHFYESRGIARGIQQVQQFIRAHGHVGPSSLPACAADRAIAFMRPSVCPTPTAGPERPPEGAE